METLPCDIQMYALIPKLVEVFRKKHLKKKELYVIGWTWLFVLTPMYEHFETEDSAWLRKKEKKTEEKVGMGAKH